MFSQQVLEKLKQAFYAKTKKKKKKNSTEHIDCKS